MKTLTALDYVTIAVSTDRSRYSIGAPWRKGDGMYGTDGHRMHWVTGLQSVDRVDYVDGRDCVPPDVDKVISTPPPVACTIRPDKDLIARLKLVCKMQPKKALLGAGCILTIGRNGITLSSTPRFPITWSCDLPGEVEVTGEPMRIGLTLSHLVDALIEGIDCEIRVTTDTDPVRVTYASTIYGDYNALIMPRKIDDMD